MWKGGKEKTNVKRRPLPRSKYLCRVKTLVLRPMDKDLLRKEAAINKSEIKTFDQERTINELWSEIEVLHRDAEEDEQTRIFGVKAERAEIEINKERAMELKAQMSEAERAR